ncbi:ParA family protein [Peribacillus frigoritolerans]|uniref:ParA family protein n=1 Tax=Peribacillus frigoritolerans TaxID=450367 RepID=UPI002079769D|nr:AAA family ATPase [Peribacillus frigoritolerans]USK77720.1 AAA family ATPase [Peribacillus frigoritolerans]
MGEKRATVITVGLQKGGVGKSTSSGILSYFLSREGYKVLAVDMDSQGNLTDLLTQQEYDYFEEKTILEAYEDGSVEKYIYEVNENLHIVPSDDYFATLAIRLYTSDEMKYIKEKSLGLKMILEPVIYDYDFVIIDTPPSLSEPMVNALCTSDYCLVIAESSKWAYNAIPRFIETVDRAKEVNPNLEILGILRTMSDSRRADSKAFAEIIKETWPELCFDVIIKRKASTGRLSLEGLFDNKELSSALDQYELFYKELKKRVRK